MPRLDWGSSRHSLPPGGRRVAPFVLRAPPIDQRERLADELEQAAARLERAARAMVDVGRS
jgi:hypothetical protein